MFTQHYDRTNNFGCLHSFGVAFVQLVFVPETFEFQVPYVVDFDDSGFEIEENAMMKSRDFFLARPQLTAKYSGVFFVPTSTANREAFVIYDAFKTVGF